MDYRSAFKASLARVRAEGRYRVFANLRRVKGEFPRARWRTDAGDVRDVVLLSRRLSIVGVLALGYLY